MPDLDELVYWADISMERNSRTRTAVELRAMRLMLVIEASHSRELIHKIIRLLQENRWQRSSMNRKFIRYSIDCTRITLIDRDHAQAARCTGGVIEFDVSAHDLDGYNKFIPYYLFRRAFTTWVSASRRCARKSPLEPIPGANANAGITKLCEEYGGGRPRAAISFKPDELDKARAAAREIAGKLQTI
jgi:hypothetical protein